MGWGRKLEVKKKIEGLEEVEMIGKMVDRVEEIKKEELVKIDIGDFGLERRGGSEERVVGEWVGIIVKWKNIKEIRKESEF